MAISPREFVDKWSQSALREQQAAQSHFNDLCELVGHKKPTDLDPQGEFFTFEEQVEKATGGKGRADVWYRDHFAWEYKGKHKDLDAAYHQLSAYRGSLGNPPLLVVCDFLEYRIYPQWVNTSAQPFVFHNEDLLRPDTLRYITWLLQAPEQFLQLRQAELERRERITYQLAEKFAHLYDLMAAAVDENGHPLWQPMQITRFLTKVVFALFAEDIGLMPRPNDMNVLSYIFKNAPEMPDEFVPLLEDLFKAMDGQRRGFLMQPVPYFNGGLFADSELGAGDGTTALDITLLPDSTPFLILQEVSEADWQAVNPTIFGTLFEGALDTDKRAQLGAHYTSEADIRLVVEPVLMRPLYAEWDAVRAESEPLLQIFLAATTAPRPREEARARLLALHDGMMTRLEQTKVLDPACGSGNFLYVSLRLMKDLEAGVRKFFEPMGLPFRDVVTPRQLYGIEKDGFAARLAHVVCWIGYLQWRYEDEGVLHPLLRDTSSPHPRQLPHPIIQDKYTPDEPDHIQYADSIMRYDADGQPYEPDWPEVDIIMGNPPFLGDKVMRTGRPELGQSGLGDQYVDDLRRLYGERLPSCDLVCYWYEKARAQIAAGKARRAGLLATNSIRGGSNRAVLDRIKESGDIFMAWGDRPWVLEGAAVRIAVIGFDNGTQKDYVLDGAPVDHINSDLQNTIDATKAVTQKGNQNIAFMGMTPAGPFDISSEQAQALLSAHNASGHSNRDVVHPYYNAIDITRRPRNIWTIDFGTSMSEADAAQYELPFEYVKSNVLPERLKSRQPEREKEKWWIYTRSRPELREALRLLNRYLATPMVSKYRIFVWLEPNVVPANLINVIARDDDYFFGVLHSYLHEIWSLRLGTWLGKGNDPRYTPTTTFETFPFPWTPGQEDTGSPAYQAISAAAQQLHEEREVWLNPPDLLALGAGENSPALRERTLTNLYNALAAYRETLIPPDEGETTVPRGETNGNGGRIPKSARDFAPRLAELHDALDQAVLAAYGWGDLFAGLHTPAGDETLLRRLLELNLKRAGG